MIIVTVVNNGDYYINNINNQICIFSLYYSIIITIAYYKYTISLKFILNNNTWKFDMPFHYSSENDSWVKTFSYMKDG